MQPAAQQRRLATLAPLTLIYAVLILVLLMIDSSVLGTLLVGFTVAVPVVFGLWLLAGVQGPRRVWLAFLAPAAQWAFLLVEFVVVWSRSGSLSGLVLALATLLPGVALLAGGLIALGRAGWSEWQKAAVLWVVALGSAVGALPAATWLAGLSRVDALAAIAVIFAPPAALGCWLGLLLAARLARGPEEVAE